MVDHKHLKINMISLIAVGTWKLKFKKDQKILKAVYLVYGTLVQGYFALFTLSQLIQLYFISGNDLDEILDNTSVSLLYSVVVAKLIVCNSKKAVKLINQVKALENEIMSEGDDQYITIYKQYMRNNYFVDNFFLIFGVFTITPFFVFPIIKILSNPERYQAMNGTLYPERPLPFSSWFPFDKHRHYYLAYAIQIVAGLYGCNYVVCTDIFFVALMIFAIGQAKILQKMVKNFRRKALDSCKSDGDCKEKEIAISAALRSCVVRHQVLIRFVHDLDNLLKLLMLLDFAICSLQMAVLAFQVIVAGFSIRQLFALEFLASMLTQLFLFYWHANEIMIESYGISEAVWDSEWYECSPRIKRSLHIMMMRSQKPLTLSVGPFYVMSTETALGILRAAYSYVALLRQTYMRKQDI